MSASVPLEILVYRIAGATAAAAFGAVLSFSTAGKGHRVLCALVSFAAGALFGVTIVHLLPEALHLTGPSRTGAGIGLGLFLFLMISRFLYLVCPACNASAIRPGNHCSNPAPHRPPSPRGNGELSSPSYLQLGLLMVVTMTLHSVTDGIAITVGYEATELTGSNVGLLIFLAVAYHKVPEGLALMTIARMAGFSPTKAFLLTLGVELTTALGVLIGLIFTHFSKASLGFILALTGGSFLYTVSFALIRELWEHEGASVLVFSAGGLTTILALAQILNH
jgi:ZIP family zinc transporter